MKDLAESSQLFEASSRLQSAATALRKIEAHCPLAESDRSTLRWSGKFLEEVDLNVDPRSHQSASGELSVQATEVRPSFYAALLNIQPTFRAAGIRADTQLQTFLLYIYRVLTSGGHLEPKRNRESSRLDLAATFLEELSKALLVRLTNNGVPSNKDLVEFSLI